MILFVCTSAFIAAACPDGILLLLRYVLCARFCKKGKGVVSRSEGNRAEKWAKRGEMKARGDSMMKSAMLIRFNFV